MDLEILNYSFSKKIESLREEKATIPRKNTLSDIANYSTAKNLYYTLVNIGKTFILNDEIGNQYSLKDVFNYSLTKIKKYDLESKMKLLVLIRERINKEAKENMLSDHHLYQHIKEGFIMKKDRLKYLTQGEKIDESKIIQEKELLNYYDDLFEIGIYFIKTKIYEDYQLKDDDHELFIKSYKSILNMNFHNLEEVYEDFYRYNSIKENLELVSEKQFFNFFKFIKNELNEDIKKEIEKEFHYLYKNGGSIQNHLINYFYILNEDEMKNFLNSRKKELAERIEKLKIEDINTFIEREIKKELECIKEIELFNINLKKEWN